jgi:hypothetical protein
MPDTAVTREWKPIHTAPENVPVLTKIDDEHGSRNEQVMGRFSNLWWINKGKPNQMYVYYTPTHWKEAPDA